MPEFNSRDDIEAWLKTRPKEQVVLFAARAALRVLPFLATDERKESTAALVLPCCRAVAAPWFAGTWPIRSAEVKVATIYTADAPDPTPLSATGSAAQATAYAVYAAISGALYATADAADAADTAVDAATAGAADRADGTAYGRIATVVYAAYSTDATALESGVGVREMSEHPLWPGNEVPSEIAELWEEMKTRLLAADEGWEVWTDWYEARLNGAPANMELEKARVLIPDEDWKQGPAHVNAIIKRLIEEHVRPDLKSGEQSAANATLKEAVSREVMARPVAAVLSLEDQLVRVEAWIDDLRATTSSNQEIDRAESIAATLRRAIEEVDALPDAPSEIAVQPAAREIVLISDKVTDLAKSEDPEDEEANDTRTAIIASLVTLLVRLGMSLDFADLILKPVRGSSRVIERIRSLQKQQ
ncbi:hypothetical protein KHP62_15310 [Rhodobacteraceae bacterium NNCM2]|nr:hypothetical protein [Coraliihabitans acroporae]